MWGVGLVGLGLEIQAGGSSGLAEPPAEDMGRNFGNGSIFRGVRAKTQRRGGEKQDGNQE